LIHAAGHPQGAPTPSGNLRIIAPGDPAERYAAAVAEGSVTNARPRQQPALYRQTAPPVAVSALSVNHDRVTVPPPAGLTFRATVAPASAPGVTLSVVGDNATIAAGTTINNSTGDITIDPAQTGGSAHVDATQNATGPGGTTTGNFTAPFNLVAIPGAIASTTSTVAGVSGEYGGNFIHTFTSPGGGATAIERAHVNEQFPGARGTTLNVTAPIGTLSVSINDPNSAARGWDLDAAGTMVRADRVHWTFAGFDARPFVANASNASPSQTLPQELLATQNFRNLTFPGRTYAAAVIASATHRRAFEDRNNQLKAITSSNAEEIEEDYKGPTVFRHIAANPASIPVRPAPVRGTPAPPATTSTITVDAEGQSARPTFSVRPPALGCTISRAGVLTPGTTPGTVTVRAGDSRNFDETTVTLTP
jgi:hypothetical protein